MISLIRNEEGTRHPSTRVLKRTVIVPHMDVFGILHSLYMRFSFLSFMKRFLRLFAIWPAGQQAIHKYCISTVRVHLIVCAKSEHQPFKIALGT